MAKQTDTEKKQKDENQAKYRFFYIFSGTNQLRQWSNRHPKFEQEGEMEYFAGFLWPVSTANVEVIERTRAEYDTIEFVILKLFSAGIRTPELLTSMTGLDIEMVVNVLNVLEFTYHHIDRGIITAEGYESLNDRKNIQSFQTGKQVQFEAVTGTVLLPVLFQSMAVDDAYLYTKNQNNIRYVMPKHYIERDVRNDIMENFDKHRERGTIHTNVEKILDISVEACTHTEAFLVKYNYLPHPFILFPVLGSKSVMWMPVAVSQSTAAEMEKRGLVFNYSHYDMVVRPDSEFECLKALEKEFNLILGGEKPTEDFKLGDKQFKVVDAEEENAKLRLHPSTGYTPVYSVQIKEEIEEKDSETESETETEVMNSETESEIENEV